MSSKFFVAKNQRLPGFLSGLAVAGLSVAGAAMPGLVAAELRQHDAHVHGHALLNAAQEGHEVELSFEIPAMDMVGFEHQPETSAQKAQIEKIHAFLKQGQKVVSFNESAKCSLEHAKVESALLSEEAHDEHDHDEKHSDHHDDHAHKGHGHEEHGHEEHGHEEHGHDEHDHEKHSEHSEFEITYHFECAVPSELSELNVLLFKQVATLQEIEANWFGESSVKKSELTPNQSSMALR
jgi:hypothetical protein